MIAARASAPVTPEICRVSHETENAVSSRRASFETWLHRAEWLTAMLLALVAAALHGRLMRNVGGLWRDEVNSVNLATLPNISDIPRLLEFDSFPLLHFGILRGWIAVFGQSDAALRALGFVTGIAILAALFLAARAFRVRSPLLSFALVGLNPIFIRYADSTRALGLGIVLILLTAVSFWSLVDSPPSPLKMAVATVTALLAVHCLYYNSVLLFAIACGAIAVAIRRREWRTSAIILGIGILAAVSLLIYVPMLLRVRAWSFMLYHPADFAWLWTRACELMGSPHSKLVWVWSGLFIGGIFLGGYALVRRNLSAPALFGFVAMIVGVVAYATFLHVLNYWTQPWYYITLAAFAACMIDVVLGASWIGVRSLRVLVAVALLCTSAQAAWREMPTRHTNVDVIGAELQRLSEPGDVVIVSGWECAIPLCRYYKGPAEILTLPPIEDHRFHRYDLVLEARKKEDAHLPLLAKVEDTLRSGHRVFFAGELAFPESDEVLPPLRAIRQDEHGAWRGSGYMLWQQYVGQTLRTHGVRFARLRVAVPRHQSVARYENLEAGVVEGWR